MKTMNETLEVKRGYFVQWEHALYGGLYYYGVFASDAEAKDFADNDYIRVLYLPYVEFDGNVFAMWEESSCWGKNKNTVKGLYKHDSELFYVAISPTA